MLDGNVLLRQKRDEVPEGTLSCPDRNLAVFHHYRHYEGLRLLPSVCDSKLIQQTLFKGIEAESYALPGKTQEPVRLFLQCIIRITECCESDDEGK